MSIPVPAPTVDAICRPACSRPPVMHRKCLSLLRFLAILVPALAAMTFSSSCANAQEAIAANEQRLPPELAQMLEFADGVDARLLKLVQDLPLRWSNLPPPRISYSPLRQVLQGATGAELDEAIAIFMKTAGLPPEARRRMIESLFERGVVTQIQLWAPALVVQYLQPRDTRLTALVLEAWLQWAEVSGRQDVLLFSTSCIVDHLLRSSGAAPLAAALDRWASLPSSAQAAAGEAALHTSRANVLFRLGQIQPALEAFRRSRALYEVAGDQFGEGHSWRGEADVLSRLGQYQPALEAYRRARSLYEVTSDLLGQGNAWRGEADVFFLLGQYQPAREAYRRARALFEATADPIGQGNSWRGEANILLRLGQNQPAREAYQRARALFEASGDRLGQGNTWKGEADVLFRLGQNQPALEAYRRARTLLEATGEFLDQGNTWSGEADVLFRLGQNQRALQTYRRARPLFEAAGDQLGQGRTWKGEADILFRLGQNQQALESYRRARAIFDAAGSQLGEGASWCGEADILLGFGQHLEALRAFRQGRALFEKSADSVGQANAWLGEARAFLKMGRLEEASTVARRALELSKDGDEPLGMINALGLLSWLDHQLGRLSNAVEHGSAALAMFRSLRGGFPDEASRIEAQNYYSRIYGDLIPSLFDLGRIAEAVTAAEEAKSPVLLDRVASRFSAQGGQPFDFSQRERELQTMLAALGRQQVESRMAGRQRLARRAELDRELEQLLFEGLLGSPLTQKPPLTFEELKTLSRAVGPILGFYVSEQSTFLYLLANGEPITSSVDVRQSDLAKSAVSFAEQLANENYRSEAEAAGRALGQLLLGPIEDHLPAGGTLVLVPHGPVHFIPLDALIDRQGRRLFERFDISVVPSLAALAQLRARHHEPNPEDNLFALAGGAGLTLPREEVRAIASLLDPLQADYSESTMVATFDSYQKHAPRAGQLFIASHGRHTEGDRRQTYLEIRPTDEHDHRLTAAEIATIPLDEVELVVLAACETAAGRVLLSDERLDLSRAFLVAGAAAVLATRWQVPDDPRTTQFLLDFYRAYRGGQGHPPQRKDQALAAARRLAVHRGDPSAIWAAWVLIGDGR